MKRGEKLGKELIWRHRRIYLYFVSLKKSRTRRRLTDEGLVQVFGLILLLLASCAPKTQPIVGVSVRLPLPVDRIPIGPATHVVLISIDGLRQDAIAAAPAKNLQEMIRKGTHCPESETIPLSLTLPSHASMLTGLDSTTHEVTWNVWRPGFISRPTILSISSGAGLTTAALFAKDKLHYLLQPCSAHWVYGPPVPPGASAGSTNQEIHSDSRDPCGWAGPWIRCEEIADAFCAEWPQRTYHLTFVHLADVDITGHERGWMGREYLDAVLRVDYAVGRMMEAIRSSGRLSKTAVIVTADHGGSGRIHYSPMNNLEFRTIPWICVGPGVLAGGVIDRTVKIFDTAPTVLSFLGLPAPPELEGNSIPEVLGRGYLRAKNQSQLR